MVPSTRDLPCLSKCGLKVARTTSLPPDLDWPHLCPPPGLHGGAGGGSAGDGLHVGHQAGSGGPADLVTTHLPGRVRQGKKRNDDWTVLEIH